MAPSVNDDLDLDGNWRVEDDPSEASTPPVSASKKRKQKADAAAAEGDESEVAKGKTTGAKKKKKKKPRTNLYSGEPEVTSDGDLCSRARSRVASSWAAEGKSRKLTPLELKELVPLPKWFLPCAPEAPLASMPSKLEDDAAVGGILGALRRKAKLPKLKARCASVVVLCLSSEQVFAELPKIEKSWGTKPLALSAFGGGRRKDQIARQAKSLEAGAYVAIVTPGRFLRLLDEGHATTEGLEAIVVDLALDRKQRDVLTLPETRRDFFALLQRHLLSGLGAGEGPRIVLCGSTSTSA